LFTLIKILASLALFGKTSKEGVSNVRGLNNFENPLIIFPFESVTICNRLTAFSLQPFFQQPARGGSASIFFVFAI